MEKEKRKIKVLLSGGGTMGSVSPLLAVYQEFKKRNVVSDFLFIGTKNGPEKIVVESYDIDFVDIESGKLRRYFDWQNFTDLFRIVKGFFQSFKLIKKFKPDVVLVAGSFVGVPVVWAAWLLRLRVIIHQQDIELGLANKLMAPFAQKITVSFDISLKDFKPGKAVLTGNPIKDEFNDVSRKKSLEFFDLDEDLPIILITGGGTGSKNINEVVKGALPKILKFAQVIHVVGKGKGFDYQHDNYRQYDFLSHQMPEALTIADLVVSRAGLSTLTELSFCGKCSIIIPMYKTHQEFNADYYRKHNAIVYVSESSFNSSGFADLLSDLLDNDSRRISLSENIKKIMPQDGSKKVVDEILKIV